MAVREEDLGNIIGPQGPQGETGPTGPKGATGATGAKGNDGATWLSGSVAPTTQGVNGDYFINTSNWDIYKKVSGTWTKNGNIKGATGAQGVKGDKGDKGDTGSQGATGPKGATGAQGPTGPQGAKGDPFAIAKTYSSINAMNAAFSTDGVNIGQFVLIDTGNVEDEDNAKLYVKGATSYSYITDLSGAKGMTGPQGPKGATGATGATGPQGLKGDKGDTGAVGPQGPQGVKGATGATGPQGPKGDAGVSPTFEIRNGHLIAIYPE